MTSRMYDGNPDGSNELWRTTKHTPSIPIQVAITCPRTRGCRMPHQAECRRIYRKEICGDSAQPFGALPGSVVTRPTFRGSSPQV